MSSSTVLVAITKHGVAKAIQLAHKMPQVDFCTSEKFQHAVADLSQPTTIYKGALRTQIPILFEKYQHIIFFVSLGAVVRLIAPHLQSKDVDPAVLVVDDQADFVIPVLSGHVGGANAAAIQVATLLQATPVVTTASDVGKTIPVDILGRELGWTVDAPKINITRVSADVVNEEPIAFIQETGSEDWWTRPTALPNNIHLFKRFEDVDQTQFKSFLWVTHRYIPQTLRDGLEERLVIYRPTLKKIILGLGCDRGTSQETLVLAVESALTQINASLAQVVGLASIDKKNDEVGLLAIAKQWQLPFHFFTAQELSQVSVPNPSDVVLKYMGTPAVSEAAALLAAKKDLSALVLEKFKFKGSDDKNVTVSIAAL
ncbi:MAG: cobalamin biosynthesis protein [Mariprofundaceae bacterium]|nr:cobalamin biosynthesis protein [Mariprofundaceae bacterium]